MCRILSWIVGVDRQILMQELMVRVRHERTVGDGLTAAWLLTLGGACPAPGHLILGRACKLPMVCKESSLFC